MIGLPSWPAERVEAEFKVGKNLWKCDTLEELCQKSGMNLDGLKKQIATWNEAAKNHNDLQFGRSDKDMYPLGKGPYYMIRMEPWNNLSCGGVRVNEDLQVLGWDMKPVNHFYAPVKPLPVFTEPSTAAVTPAASLTPPVGLQARRLWANRSVNSPVI